MEEQGDIVTDCTLIAIRELKCTSIFEDFISNPNIS